MAGAPAVVLDQRDAGCQLVIDLTHNWIAVLHLQVAEGYPRNQDKRRSLASDGEGQGHSIAAAGIAQLRRRAQRTDCIRKRRVAIRDDRAVDVDVCPATVSNVFEKNRWYLRPRVRSGRHPEQVKPGRASRCSSTS